jgi:iron(III) transport system ATP-binding protein
MTGSGGSWLADWLPGIGKRLKAADVAALADPAGPRRAGATFSSNLVFEGVERRFGDRAALDHVSLGIAPGEVVCLLGPSGCGKTTLLRIAAGIERPSGGRVLINDREVAGPTTFVAPEKRNVGLMFQDFALFPHLTILENVAFGLSSLPRLEGAKAALAVLDRVGLANLADAFPHTLSGGQQQRVALARAIVPRPSVLLMDEPFSGLDVQLREQILDETLAILRETRATSMIVTHDPTEAMRMADRIAVMRAGRIVQVGKPEDLYRYPNDLFVAQLFSDVNEIPGRVVDGFIVTPIGRFQTTDLDDGDAVVIAIRERAIRLREPGRGLPGRVLRVRFEGDLARLFVGVGGFEKPLQTVVREQDVRVRGQEVGIEIDPQGVLIFKAEGRADGAGDADRSRDPVPTAAGSPS